MTLIRYHDSFQHLTYIISPTLNSKRTNIPIHSSNMAGNHLKASNYDFHRNIPSIFSNILNNRVQKTHNNCSKLFYFSTTNLSTHS